jgi:predicted GNAT family N-acyltransferase
VTVRVARDAAELKDAQDLRVRVFCGEQGVAPELELDGLDDEATHIVALDESGVIATCRLRFSGESCKLERMAVETDRRGLGVGMRLLEGAEDEARRQGAGEVELKGQVAARGFYERGGYTVLSEEIVEDAGIDHVRMSRAL